MSIILPTCDRASLLPRALESVVKQSEQNWELWLVDDNRNQPPIERLPAVRALAHDPRVHVLARAGRQNAAAARNAALDRARGRWITYLDDDDAYRPTKLARQLELAEDGVPLVLCGAEFHLKNRRRLVQCDAPAWTGDHLILKARWNTPLLFHRHPGQERFDETLSPGEDAEFGHRLLALNKEQSVRVCPVPLVDIYPQDGMRVNSNSKPLLEAAHKILALRPGFYSTSAQKRYLLQNELAVAKLTGRTGACMRLSTRLLLASRGRDWRACANACVVSLGWWRGRWVS